MPRVAMVTGSIFAIVVFCFSCAVWSASGRAPYFVSSSADWVTKILFGSDPHTRCSRAENIDGLNILNRSYIQDRNCYRYAPPRRYKGIYFDEFEGQLFIEGAHPAKQYIEPKDRIWIDRDKFSDVSVLEKAEPQVAGGGKTRIWQIEFVGRKTSEPGRYGHMGNSQHEVLIDRVLTARLLTEINGYAGSNVLVR